MTTSEKDEMGVAYSMQKHEVHMKCYQKNLKGWYHLQKME